jgi:homocysteine S-methyltransferase
MTSTGNPETPTVRPGEQPFGEFLAGSGIALFDGAMGTMLYAKGIFINLAFEELNLSRPGLVREVHAEYVAAGADILESNTFAANRFRLSPHGLADSVAAINISGVEIAREAAGRHAWVAGAMGPLGVRIEPFGPISRNEAREVFEEQARALAEAGVDLFIIETFSHLPEMEEAIRAVRAVADVPIVAQVAVAKRGVTREGVAPGQAAVLLAEAGADAVGVNCSEALSVLDALEGMREAVATPLSAQPNAGQPHTVDGRNIYLATPDYLVAWGRRAIRGGARLLGGCCGTTPDHIRALRQAIGGGAAPVAAAPRIIKPVVSARTPTPLPPDTKSRLAKALLHGQFVTGVELPLPTGWEVDRINAATRRLDDAGLTFVAFPDGPRNEARMSPITMAQLVTRPQGAEPVVHYSCRARRLPRIQSDMLGACAQGIANILVVTGEPISPGMDAPADLDVDSIGTVNLLVCLNHGQDFGGNVIGRPTRFFTGVRIDPTHFDRERELSRLFWKVDAGAEFAITAPVFDPHALQEFLAGWNGPTIPVIATIWPLRSAREAEFFEQELAEVPVPAELVKRMQQAEKDGREIEEGIAIARELAVAIKPQVQGIQIVAPDLKVESALAVLG